MNDFAELANFVLELCDLRFDSLILLIEPAFVFELHGERREIGEVIMLTTALAAPLAALITPLSALVAPLALAALARVLSALATPLVVVLTAPHEALAASKR